MQCSIIVGINCLYKQKFDKTSGKLEMETRHWGAMEHEQANYAVPVANISVGYDHGEVTGVTEGPRFFFVYHIEGNKMRSQHATL